MRKLVIGRSRHPASRGTRTSLCVGAVAMLFAVAAWAKPGWTEPGWYQMADTILGPFVWKGPFPDEASCRSSLPPNEDEADYDCEYLKERPSWDE
jgi:hypothetical protein